MSKVRFLYDAIRNVIHYVPFHCFSSSLGILTLTHLHPVAKGLSPSKNPTRDEILSTIELLYTL